MTISPSHGSSVLICDTRATLPCSHPPANMRGLSHRPEGPHQACTDCGHQSHPPKKSVTSQAGQRNGTCIGSGIRCPSKHRRAVTQRPPASPPQIPWGQGRRVGEEHPAPKKTAIAPKKTSKRSPKHTPQLPTSLLRWPTQ